MVLSSGSPIKPLPAVATKANMIPHSYPCPLEPLRRLLPSISADNGQIRTEHVQAVRSEAADLRPDGVMPREVPPQHWELVQIMH